MAVSVAGVGKQVRMQENEPQRGQLALSDADRFWTLMVRKGAVPNASTPRSNSREKIPER